MATIEKRINFTPSSRVSALLREFSRLSGKPASAFVREWLESAIPTLEGMVEAFRVITMDPDNARAAAEAFHKKSLAQVREMESELQQQSLDLDSAMKRKPGRKPSGKAKKGREAAKV